MALSPPVSAMKGTIGPSRAASAAVDGAGGVGAAGEGDAVAAGMGDQRLRRRVSPPPGSQRQQARIEARGVEQPHRLGGDQRRLLGRLGQHRVAGRQRRGDLAGEDGSGKFHGLMAGEDAAAVQLQRVGLADRARQRLGPGEVRARPDGA